MGGNRKNRVDLVELCVRKSAKVTGRLKRQEDLREETNSCFWRTYDKKEIDFVEECRGKYGCLNFTLTSSLVGRLSEMAHGPP